MKENPFPEDSEYGKIFAEALSEIQGLKGIIAYQDALFNGLKQHMLILVDAIPGLIKWIRRVVTETGEPMDPELGNSLDELEAMIAKFKETVKE